MKSQLREVTPAYLLPINILCVFSMSLEKKLTCFQGIGLLSQTIVLLENSTITPRITRNQPIYKSIQCIGEHAPGIPHNLKRAIAQSYDSDRALRKVEDIIFKNDIMRSVVANTQAVDVIAGGVKSNALPETRSVAWLHGMDWN